MTKQRRTSNKLDVTLVHFFSWVMDDIYKRGRKDLKFVSISVGRGRPNSNKWCNYNSGDNRACSLNCYAMY